MSDHASHADHVRELAESLEQLYAFKPQSRVDMNRWFEQARRLEARLVMDGGLSAEVPELLWHYLADADIRLKDKEYAESQDRRIRLLLQYLKRGEIPSDDEIATYASYG